jgi:hypothetical protein
MTTPYILFRFISAESSKATDSHHDTAKIMRTAEGAYELTYRYYDNGVSHTMTMSDTSVFRWVRHTLRQIEVDDDPVKEIQIDWPLMPTVMILTKNIGTAYHAILDALEWHLDNWPSTARADCRNDPSVPIFYPEETIPIDPDTAMSIDSPPTTPVLRPYSFRPPPTGRHHLFFDSNEERE